MRISRESEKLSAIRRQFFDKCNAARAIEQYFRCLWSIYLQEQDKGFHIHVSPGRHNPYCFNP